jgi:hypothetical protein
MHERHDHERPVNAGPKGGAGATFPHGPRNRFARRMLVGVGALLAAVGAVFISPMGQAIAGFASAPPPPPAAEQRTGGVPDVGPKTGQPQPTLSATQREEALALARAVPAVRELLTNPGASTLIVPWTTLSGGRFIGAGIDVTWDSPITVSASWPSMAYDETETVWPPYETTTAVVRASNLTGVHVAIDLLRKKVVSVEPLQGATISRFEVDPAFRNTLPPQAVSPR